VVSVNGSANQRAISFDSGQAATARHRMWPAVMSVAAAKYGGDQFPESAGPAAPPSDQSGGEPAPPPGDDQGGGDGGGGDGGDNDGPGNGNGNGGGNGNGNGGDG
jgi:hypothetical protein